MKASHRPHRCGRRAAQASPRSLISRLQLAYQVLLYTNINSPARSALAPTALRSMAIHTSDPLPLCSGEFGKNIRCCATLNILFNCSQQSFSPKCLRAVRSAPRERGPRGVSSRHPFLLCVISVEFLPYAPTDTGTLLLRGYPPASPGVGPTVVVPVVSVEGYLCCGHVRVDSSLAARQGSVSSPKSCHEVARRPSCWPSPEKKA